MFGLPKGARPGELLRVRRLLAPAVPLAILPEAALETVGCQTR
jgi:hypothetical protein